MMLSRIAGRAPLHRASNGHPSGMRSYSYFSQRHGKFFNSSRPSSSTRKPSGPSSRPAVASPHAQEVDAQNQSKTLSTSDGLNGKTSSERADPQDAAGSSSSALSGSANAKAPDASPSRESDVSTTEPSTRDSQARAHHPEPQLPSLHLHTFFSQHRPLLLLDQPLPSLFSTPNVATVLSNPSPASPPHVGQPLPSTRRANSIPTPYDGHGQSSAGFEDVESDSDIARMLAHAMVQQRIRSSSEWGQVLSELGLPDVTGESISAAQVDLDSVKQKRKKKMNRHKLKKRRRKQRAERRRLGK